MDAVNALSAVSQHLRTGNAYSELQKKHVMQIVLKCAIKRKSKRGLAEIGEFYAGSMATGAKLELLGTPRCAGDCVAFPFAVKLEFGEQKTVIEVIDTFRIDESGKIAEMRAFWGPANMKSA